MSDDEQHAAKKARAASAAEQLAAARAARANRTLGDDASTDVSAAAFVKRQVRATACCALCFLLFCFVLFLLLFRHLTKACVCARACDGARCLCCAAIWLAQAAMAKRNAERRARQLAEEEAQAEAAYEAADLGGTRVAHALDSFRVGTFVARAPPTTCAHAWRARRLHQARLAR